MVEIFKTNIQNACQSQILMSLLSADFPAYVINFDLEDCDKVLRVEAREVDVLGILTILRNQGYECSLLI